MISRVLYIHTSASAWLMDARIGKQIVSLDYGQGQLKLAIIIKTCQWSVCLNLEVFLCMFKIIPPKFGVQEQCVNECCRKQ